MKSNHDHIPYDHILKIFRLPIIVVKLIEKLTNNVVDIALYCVNFLRNELSVPDRATIANM